MHRHSKTSPKALARNARDAEICKMREAGASLKEIGNKYGLVESSVWAAIVRHSRAVPAQAAQSLQERQLSDCELLRSKLLPLCERGDLDAMMVLLKTSAREAKIAGTDAPTKTQSDVNVQVDQAGESVSEQLQEAMKDPVWLILQKLLSERQMNAFPNPTEDFIATQCRELWSVWLANPNPPAPGEKGKAPVVDAEVISPPERLSPPRDPSAVASPATEPAPEPKKLSPEELLKQAFVPVVPDMTPSPAPAKCYGAYSAPAKGIGPVIFPDARRTDLP